MSFGLARIVVDDTACADAPRTRLAPLQPGVTMKALRIIVHPTHPQARLVRQAAALVADGAVLVCPTDACYSLVGQIGNKSAEDRIRAIRKLDERHNFALMCHDVSSLAQYGKVSNEAYRLIRMLTPGPYTFILPSTRETPRRLQDRKRKTVGLRVPAHPFISALTAELGEPVMGSTVFDDALDIPYAEPDDMLEQLRHAVDAVVDAGAIGIDMTTVLDLTGDGAALVREGKGDIDAVAEWL